MKELILFEDELKSCLQNVQELAQQGTNTKQNL